MELKQVEILLEKYFEGETSLSEEKQLKAYFTSDNIATHLEQYKPLFVSFQEQKEIQFTKSLPLQPRKQKNVKWIGIAAGFVVLFGIATFYNKHYVESDLGTFEDPQEAFIATQKALELVSEQVNYGVEGVAVLQEFEQSKNKIFKK
ncbi:hypothetical protein ACFS5J_02015 [Flavobacterium chuncheonense]|uniref:Anti-sigma factor n=1 Tax=Flavobacterium chuncheonense TaxID=2026653 RepID=A0ABW5YIH3_9FLAO